MNAAGKEAWRDQVIAKIMAKRSIWDRAAECAGPNPMAHHDSAITFGGMDGALQMFCDLLSAERAKFRAGSELQHARKLRFAGEARGAAICLNKAAGWRREAVARSGVAA